MKYSLFVTLNLAALLVAGCSSTPTRVDTGSIHAATFSFVQGRPAPPEYAEQRAHIHTLIQNAITANRVESRINSRITRRCSGFGSRSTVCSVVTMGMRNSRNNAST